MREAIANNLPVVALESTIISHGMPYPRNIEVARDVEAVIRRYGAVPATCAIIDGTYRIISYHIVAFRFVMFVRVATRSTIQYGTECLPF